MRTLFFGLLVALGLLTGCRKEMPPCGLPVFGFFLTYQLIDPATGRDWFLGAGRPPGDSLRLLAADSYDRQYARRKGNRVLLGPIRLIGQIGQTQLNGRPAFTHYLRVSATDVDTVVTLLRYGAVQHGPCDDYAPVEEVEVLFNGRSAGTFRSSTPADSLRGSYLDRTVQLPKR